jgi:predicted transcriptional regulator
VRTTVTLATDVAAKLKKLAQRSGRSFKATLDEVLRRGLAAQERAATRKRFVVEPHSGGFRPGVDEAKLNQMLDQLDAAEFTRKARSRT